MTKIIPYLKFEDLRPGMKVIDLEGEENYSGTIVECEDIHNVFLEYENGGGASMMCWHESCEEYDGPHYLISLEDNEKFEKAIMG